MLMARVSDTVVGMCTCSTPPYPDVGIISVGDPMHIDMGSPVARIGNTVTFSCGVASIVSGTPTDISGGTLVARTGDSATGCGNGTIVSSSIDISM